MKNAIFFLSAILGLMLASGVVSAYDCDLTVIIQEPKTGLTTGSEIILYAKTNVTRADCYYTLDENPVSPIMLRAPGGKIHNATIPGLSSGEHTIRVDCTRHMIAYDCTYTANASVTWNVEGDSVSVPEFPSSAIPAVLSFASFAFVSRRLK